jgi:hypothetical protein
MAGKKPVNTVKSQRHVTPLRHNNYNRHSPTQQSMPSQFITEVKVNKSSSEQITYWNTTIKNSYFNQQTIIIHNDTRSSEQTERDDDGGGDRTVESIYRDDGGGSGITERKEGRNDRVRIGHYQLELPVLLLHTTITKLVLYNCKLTKMPEAIFLLGNLQELYLSNNQIRSIDCGNNRNYSFQKLQNLNYISLSYNQLTTLPFDLFQLPSLNYVNVNLNPLTRFYEQLANSSSAGMIRTSNRSRKFLIVNCTPQVPSLLEICRSAIIGQHQGTPENAVLPVELVEYLNSDYELKCCSVCRSVLRGMQYFKLISWISTRDPMLKHINLHCDQATTGPENHHNVEFEDQCHVWNAKAQVIKELTEYCQQLEEEEEEEEAEIKALNKTRERSGSIGEDQVEAQEEERYNVELPMHRTICSVKCLKESMKNTTRSLW